MAIAFILLFWFGIGLFVLLLNVPKNESSEYNHDDPELDRLIEELLKNKIEKKRHLKVVEKDEDVSGQTDSKTNS